MRKILGLTLGIMTALGGFVDLGQIVFTMQAGALFGFALLWVIALGTAAIIIYMEMCGRVAVVAQEPVFAVVRARLGDRLGLVTLIASNLLNLITCAAELGGMAIVLQMLTGWGTRLCLILAVLSLGAAVGLLKFEWIERTFGLSGLLMIAFAVAAVSLRPDWAHVSRGFLPNVPVSGSHALLLYAYFAVGIFSAMLMEYEVHFYSSGAIEEDWKVEDLGQNVAVAGIGSVLGAVLTCALLVLGTLVFLPHRIFPNAISTTAMTVALPFGPRTLQLGLLGILACISGAAVETALSGAYNICQFYNLAWGKSLKMKDAPVYTALWISMFAVAAVIAITGIKPLTLVNFSIVFGMVIMPLTYFPILKSAGDSNLMGKHANGKFYDVVGWIFLVMITVAAAAAIPLMILTHSGRP
ncbi:MAG TPA: divalent metal cation transporter [Terriglobales bacterium]|nr:divalent metal cation transporter [Terriglobales bacterium]